MGGVIMNVIIITMGHFGHYTQSGKGRWSALTQVPTPPRIFPHFIVLQYIYIYIYMKKVASNIIVMEKDHILFTPVALKHLNWFTGVQGHMISI